MPEPIGSPIITRFAPSPTGHLHIGGARTALFCWAFARRQAKEGRDGRFLIRIEDTDQARSSEASARGILEDLAWLGILWDEGPVLGNDTGDQATGIGKESRTIGGDPRSVAPFEQSKRLDIYNRVIDDMISRGLAYADDTSGEELASARKAAEAEKRTFRFHPGAIKPLDQQRALLASGRPCVVRFRAADEPVTVVDRVLGEVKFGPGEVDDFVLRKADGFPTYHFGVVVDDELMGVTHVLRGQEHLMNTPRHVALQKALGYRTPVYAHMPLIFNDQGAKMSKRERDQTARKAVKDAKADAPPAGCGIDAAVFTAWLGDTKRQLETGQLESLALAMNLSLPEVSVDDFRKAGYLPEVICNFIALLGWNPGMKNADGTNLERFDMEFLAANFDLDRIGKTNARFDRKKLMAFNADMIGSMTDEAFADRWLAWCRGFAPGDAAARLASLSREKLVLLAKAVKPRARTLREALKPAGFALIADDAVVYDPAAMDKVFKAGNARELLAKLGARLESLAAFDPASINALLEQVASESSMKIGDIAQPLRVAVTGSTVSPGLGETLAVLGKQSVLKRINRCLQEGIKA